MADSSIPKFFEKSREERIDIVSRFCNLTSEEVQVLKNSGGISFNQADGMIENAIGTLSFPLGIATNFQINGKDYLVPMVIEEPSVIAAASKAAKIARKKGGFTAQADESYSIGQIQVIGAEVKSASNSVMESSNEILQLANTKSKSLSKMGRGAKQVSCREIKASSGSMLVVELLIDVGEAMGANITNTMCEAVAPLIEKLTGGKVLLKILSNYSTKRLAKATATFDKDEVGGSEIVDNIILAYEFAESDVYRAVTHNKGVMNGIIAVANATGQDTRAIDAAAHAYTARKGSYGSLTEWKKDKDGNLVGSIELPLAVGIVGGVTNVHPMVQICNKILRVSSAKELACVIAAAGLAQNFSALRALASEGIQKGHMKLHARNFAVSVGAKPEQVDTIVKKMISEGDISIHRAKEILCEL